MIATVILALTMTYVGWALLHHWRRGDLHRKVVLEYLGIAILGIVAAMSMLRFL